MNHHESLVTVRTVGTDSHALIDFAQARIGSALGQHAGQVIEVTLRLRDVNGPRGGADKHCMVIVRLRGGMAPVILEETSDDAYNAVAHLATRIKQSVGRVLDKHRRGRHQPVSLRSLAA